MDRQPLDHFLDLCEHSETYNVRLVNIMGRITHQWIDLRNELIAETSPAETVETLNKKDKELRQKIKNFESLITELTEVFKVIVKNKANLIASVSAIAQWVHENFTPKING